MAGWRGVMQVAGSDPYAWKGYESHPEFLHVRSCKAAEEARVALKQRGGSNTHELNSSLNRRMLPGAKSKQILKVVGKEAGALAIKAVLVNHTRWNSLLRAPTPNFHKSTRREHERIPA